MKELIEIENLNIKYDKKILFNDLKLVVKENTFLAILGSNKSGKSHLTDIISLKKYHKNVKIKGQNITEIMSKTFKQEILYITSKPNNFLKNKTIKQYMNEIFSDSLLTRPIKNLLKLKEIENKTFDELSLGEKNRIQFLQYFIKQPILVVLDNAFSNMTSIYKQPILEYLEKECLNKATTVVMVSDDVEDTIYSFETGFIINGKIVSLKTLEAYEDENIFKEVNFKRPFTVELSTKLKYYDLINKTYLDEEKLVQKLWKSS